MARAALHLAVAAACVLLGAAVSYVASLPGEDALRALLLPVAVADAGLFWIALKHRPPAARAGASLLAPLLIVVIGVGGYWYYWSGGAEASLVTTGGVGVIARATLARRQYLPTLTLFLMVAGLLLLGARCWRPSGVRSTSWSADLRTGLAPMRTRAMSHVRGLLWLAGIPIVLLVVGYTPWNMIDRDVYRDPAGISTLFRAGSILSLAGAIIAASVLALPVHASQRRLALMIFVTYIVMNFSFATRELALMPLAWLLGRVLAGGTMPRLRILVTAAVATVLIYSVPLTLRALDDDHGLIPYTTYVATHPGTLVDVDADRAMKNVFQTFGVTGWVAFNVEPIDIRYLLLSVNPLPSGMVGWDAAAEELKVTSYAPYGAIGQLANHGPIFLAGYSLVLGAMLGSIDQTVKRVRPAAALLIRILSTGVGALLTFQFVQYHIRSVSRLATVAFVAAHAVAAFDRARRREHPTRHRRPVRRVAPALRADVPVR